MKLLTFHRNNILQLGIRTEAGVIDVAQASEKYPGHSAHDGRRDSRRGGGDEGFAGIGETACGSLAFE